MAIADRGAGRRWPWVEAGEGATASEIGMQIFRDAADGTTRAVVLADADGAIVYANHAFQELTGDDARQITRDGMAAWSGMSPGAVEDLWRELRRGKAWRGELQIRDARAKSYRALSSISPLKDARGRVTHLLGCYVDRGEDDTAKNALRSAQGGAGVRRTGDDCFLTVLDRDVRIVYNQRTQPGLSNADVLGTLLRDHCPPEQYEIIAPRMARAFRAGAEDSYEILGEGAHGTTSHYAIWTGPLSVGGQVIAAVSKSRDITGGQSSRLSGASSNGEVSMAPSAPMGEVLLSSRELEVTRLLADGLTNHEIADSLVIARRTVDHHVAHILTKLGAANRAAAVYLAMKGGLIRSR